MRNRPLLVVLVAVVTLLTGSAVVDGLECNATGPVIPIGVLGGDDPAAVRAVELAIDLAYEALGVVINVTVWKPGCTDDATDDMAAFDSAGVAAVIGPNCSTMAISAQRTGYDIPMVSYFATATVLEDEPFFVRTVPDDRQQSQAMAMLIERYGWQRIALLHTETAYSNDGANLVAARLPSSVEVELVLLPRNLTHAQRQAALLPLTASHFRTFVVFMGRTALTATLEAMDAVGASGRGYAILMSESANAPRDLLISTASIRAGVGSLITGLNPSGFSFAQQVYPGLFEARFGEPPGQMEAYVTDAVIAVGTAVANNRRACHPDPLNNTALMQALRNITVDGVSGPISFSSDQATRQETNYAIVNAKAYNNFLQVGFAAILPENANNDGPVDITPFLTGTVASQLTFSEEVLWPGSTFFTPTNRVYKVFHVMSMFYNTDAADRQALDAFEIALEDINSADILGGGDVLLVPEGFRRDFGCSFEPAQGNITEFVAELRTAAIDAAAADPSIDQNVFFADSLPIAAIGPTCSSDAIAIAPALHALGIASISPSATSMALSNTTAHPSFVRLKASDDIQAEHLVRVFAELGWRRVGVLGSDEAFGRSGIAAISLFGPQFGISVTSVAFPHEEVRDSPDAAEAALMPLLDADCAVIVIWAFTDVAALLVSALHNRDLLAGRTTQLVFVDNVMDSGVFDSAVGGGSVPAGTPEDSPDRATGVKEGMEDSIGLLQLLSSGSPFFDIFAAKYKARTGDPEILNIAPFVYDSLLLLANAIRAAKEATADPSRSVTPPAVNAAIRQLSFEGVTGQISFAAATQESRNNRLGVTFRGVGYSKAVSNVTGQLIDGTQDFRQFEIKADPPGTGPGGTTPPVQIVGPVVFVGGAIDAPLVACPPGTEGSLVAPLRTSCAVCDDGSFAAPNSGTCEVCPAMSADGMALTCPLGSAGPVRSDLLTRELQETAPIQPGPLVDPDVTVRVAAVYSGIGGFIILIYLIVLCVMRNSRSMLHSLARADFYSLKHPTHIGEPLIRRRTILGGVASISQITLGLVLVAYITHSALLDRYEVATTVVLGTSTLRDPTPVFLNVTLLGADVAYGCNGVGVEVIGALPPDAVETQVYNDGSECSLATTISGKLPQELDLLFEFPATRAAAIAYRIESYVVAPDEAHVVEGMVRPPAGSVLFGPVDSLLDLRAQPIRVEDISLVLSSGFDDISSGYVLYETQSLPGSTRTREQFLDPVDGGDDRVGLRLHANLENTVLTYRAVPRRPPLTVLANLFALGSGLFALVGFVLFLAERGTAKLRRVVDDEGNEEHSHGSTIKARILHVLSLDSYSQLGDEGMGGGGGGDRSGAAESGLAADTSEELARRLAAIERALGELNLTSATLSASTSSSGATTYAGSGQDSSTSS